MKTLRLLLVLSLASVMHGQTSFNTTAGGDQIYNSYGLQTAYKWHRLTGWTGVGYNDGVVFGGFLKVPLARASTDGPVLQGARHVDLGIGDQRLPAFLDTDEYDSHGFSVRGVSLIRRSKTSTMTSFSGLLSEEQVLPYMHTGYTSSGSSFHRTALAATIYERKLSDTLQLHSLNLMESKLTSIQSLGWNPSKTWRFAGAGGVGSGSPYVAGSGEFHKEFVDARTSYTVAGKDFQRQEQPYYSTEPIGWNARLIATPITALRMSLAHDRSRTTFTGQPSVTGTIDAASLTGTIAGFSFSPSVSNYTTNNLPGSTLTEMMSASRRILPRWRAFGAYIHSESPSFKQQTLVAVNEFRVSPRLAIRQNYNRMDGQNNFSFGGQWVSNRISVSVDQQVYFSPIAQSFGGKTVFQAWTFNIRMRTPHGTNVNINTVVAPDGTMQWGGYMSGLRYNSVAPQRSTTPLFSKYVIRGKVVDEAGVGVWGIAVQIGQELVLTDEAGEFFLDVKNTKPMAVTVTRASSLQTAHWEVTHAPATAQGQLDTATVDPLQITVVRHGNQ